MAIHDQYLAQATKKNRMVPGTDAAGTLSGMGEAMGSGASDGPVQPGSTQGNGDQPSNSQSSTDEYFQLAKDQEYKLLMDKEIALEQAKANALKYTRNQIAGQGFSGTGYGSTIQTGIHNDYLNRINEAKSVYGENMRTIGQQELEASETESALDFGNMASDIREAQSVDLLNDYMSSYGLLGDDGKGNMVLGSYDENDEFVVGRKPDNMSESEWNRLKYMYESQKYALNEGSDSVYYGQGFSSYGEFSGKTEEGVDAKGGDWSVDWELRCIFSEGIMANAQNGDCVKLKNGQGGKGADYLFMIFKDGKWYQCTARDYANAKHYAEFTSNSKTQYQTIKYNDLNWQTKSE